MIASPAEHFDYKKRIERFKERATDLTPKSALK
jgi:hypothetical protein